MGPSIRVVCLLVVPAATVSCVSQRLDAYLEQLAGCTSTSESGAVGSSGESEASSTGDARTDTGETTGESTGSESTEGETTGGETTGSDTTGAMSSSSGEPPPVCGNGVLEAFGAVPEECDDGNLDPEDGCSDGCALDRVVFVSSAEYQAGALESTKIADALCANLADDAGFPDGLRYKAWLSDSDEDARDRLKRGRGRLVLVNGLVVAPSWDALLAGQLENPISVTEKSETYAGVGVWTGTRPDGTRAAGAEFCADWSSSSFQKTGHYGYSDALTTEWTYSQNFDNPIPCNTDFAIYCFQSL